MWIALQVNYLFFLKKNRLCKVTIIARHDINERMLLTGLYGVHGTVNIASTFHQLEIGCNIEELILFVAYVNVADERYISFFFHEIYFIEQSKYFPVMSNKYPRIVLL